MRAHFARLWLISITARKLKLPCMNNPISRKITRKICRYSYTFNMRSDLIIRVQSPETVTLRTFRWFLIQQVPLRVKPSTYILAQIRPYRNTVVDNVSAICACLSCRPQSPTRKACVSVKIEVVTTTDSACSKHSQT